MKVKIIGGPQNGSTVEGVSDSATEVEIQDPHGNVLFSSLPIRKLSDGSGAVYWPQKGR